MRVQSSQILLRQFPGRNASVGGHPRPSADDRGEEVIDATAMGTSTQMGRVISVKVTIYEFSTDDDRAILVDAFKQGQNKGLVNALTRMKSVGRIAITGTIGYAPSYIPPRAHANRPQDSVRHKPSAQIR